MMSEFGINIGDPLVRRIDNNDQVTNTHTDANPGTPIVTTPTDQILKTLIADINSDGLQDLLIIYQNGKVKRFKTYGGNDPFTDLQDLLRIAESIKDVYLGDVDNNGYADIIVKTQSDRLRIYTNQKGIFPVDGRPACLQLPGNMPNLVEMYNDTSLQYNPDSIRMAKQLFFEDMDRDGNIDIITNDEDGDIKIHYGGTVEIAHGTRE